MKLRRLLLRLTGSAAMSLALVAAPAVARDPSVSPPAADAAAAAPARPSRERARMNQRVFDRVWTEVRGEYYDPGLHGVDWARRQLDGLVGQAHELLEPYGESAAMLKAAASFVAARRN